MYIGLQVPNYCLLQALKYMSRIYCGLFGHTVDDDNPERIHIDNLKIIPKVLVNEVMQDFHHQQKFEHLSRCLSCNLHSDYSCRAGGTRSSSSLLLGGPG